LQGRTQKDENSVKILVDTLVPMDKAEETWITSINFHLDITRTKKEMIVKFYDTVKKYPGLCPAYINLRDPGKAEAVVALPDTMKIRPDPKLAAEVNELFGYKAVETVCREVDASPGFNNFSDKKNKRYGNV
jgi:hypothetical protein